MSGQHALPLIERSLPREGQRRKPLAFFCGR
jgi:hypothetical protein